MEKELIVPGVSGPPLPNISIGQLILDSLQKSPLRIVQVEAHTGKILTSHDLLEKSVRLAVALQKWGLDSGDVVAISSETQLNWFVAACAALYLGNCVAPLNPAYTEHEVLHALTISKPRIIFVSRQTSTLVHRLASTVPWKMELIQLEDESLIENIVTLNSMISQKNQWPDHHHYQAQPVDDPSAKEIVILCSSGTSGLPKGVMLSHRNILAAIRAFHLDDFGGITEHTVALFVVPFFHGYGWALMLTILTQKATAIAMKSFDPKLFCESVEKYRIHVLPMVPATMLFLGKHPMTLKYDFSSVVRVACGGADLPNEVHEAVLKRVGAHVLIKNSYGMTELSVLTNCAKHYTKKIGTVGPPTPGANYKVVDPETSKALGPNETGELCCKGEHVMLGYRDNPRATAETIDSDGWLHTGDLGYYDTDGDMFVVGRCKELIKCKGFQIAPAEIENLLLSHDQVEDVAVVGKSDERCGEVPMAFVVKKKGARATAEQLTQFVNDRISIQKQLRGGVAFIEQIPKNPAGKILRRELLKLIPKL